MGPEESRVIDDGVIRSEPDTAAEHPHSPRLQRVLHHATQIARQLGHPHVGVEHVVLVAVMESRGLQRVGIDVGAVLQSITAAMAAGEYSGRKE